MEIFAFRGEYLRCNDKIPCEEISPEAFFEQIFYRDTAFSEGMPFEEEQCQEYLDWKDQKPLKPDQPWRYNAIALSIRSNKGVNLGFDRKNKHYIITRDLQWLDLALASDFLIMSPITYVGKNRTSANSRFLYAIAIDLDGVGKNQIADLIHQMHIKELPTANLFVNSGHGLHLYYILERPVALFEDAKIALGKLKRALIDEVWNMYTSTIEDRQYQGIFQGFRVPGSKTKLGNKVTVYKSEAKTYSVSELNSYISDPKEKLTDAEVHLLEKGVFNPNRLTLDVAKNKYPEWYERVIVRGDKTKQYWKVKRDLYDWWLNRLRNRSRREVKEGHRYFCLLALAMFAKKCDVSYEELEEDCYSLVERMDEITTDPDNHFSKEDAQDALQAYKDNYCTFPRGAIEKLTAIPIEKNRRNGRKQAEHLEEARLLRDFRLKKQGRVWTNLEGRPKGSTKSAEESPMAKIVRKWREDNPMGSKYACIKATGISKPTVYKWWNC